MTTKQKIPHHPNNSTLTSQKKFTTPLLPPKNLNSLKNNTPTTPLQKTSTSQVSTSATMTMTMITDLLNINVAMNCYECA